MGDLDTFRGNVLVSSKRISGVMTSEHNTSSTAGMAFEHVPVTVTGGATGYGTPQQKIFVPLLTNASPAFESVTALRAAFGNVTECIVGIRLGSMLCEYKVKDTPTFELSSRDNHWYDGDGNSYGVSTLNDGIYECMLADPLTGAFGLIVLRHRPDRSAAQSAQVIAAGASAPRISDIANATRGDNRVSVNHIMVGAGSGDGSRVTPQWSALHVNNRWIHSCGTMIPRMRYATYVNWCATRGVSQHGSFLYHTPGYRVPRLIENTLMVCPAYLLGGIFTTNRPMSITEYPQDLLSLLESYLRYEHGHGSTSFSELGKCVSQFSTILHNSGQNLTFEDIRMCAQDSGFSPVFLMLAAHHGYRFSIEQFRAVKAHTLWHFYSIFIARFNLPCSEHSCFDREAFADNVAMSDISYWSAIGADMPVTIPTPSVGTLNNAILDRLDGNVPMRGSRRIGERSRLIADINQSPRPRGKRVSVAQQRAESAFSRVEILDD